MISVTPSQIIEYLYCPRYTYFEYVLGIPQHEEKYYKVLKGREIHDEKLNANKDYIRKRIGVIEKYQDIYFSEERIRGVVDEVLLLKDGTMAPLDYKFAEYKDNIFNTYRIQSYCYAIMIEKTFNKTVNKGYIVFTRSKNLVKEVQIPADKKEAIYKIIDNMILILDENVFPKATKYKKQCPGCSYRNICIK